MTRMESIRRQYEGATTQSPQDGGGRMHPTRPRNVFWRWFWFFFLISLLAGFFAAKGTFADWLRHMRGDGSRPEAASGAAGEMLRNAHQGVTASVDGASVSPAAQISVEAFRNYVNPTGAELTQLFEYVRNAPCVRSNPQYSAIMSTVAFTCDSNDNSVNAYAALGKPDPNQAQSTRIIVCKAGAARFSRVAALAAAAEMQGDSGASKRFLAAHGPADYSAFTDEVAARIVANARLLTALGSEAVLTRARSISAGMMLGVLAHEAGHHALGHVGDKPTCPDVLRNHEREADSFASSVMASSPFGEYILIGTLFWHYALAQQVDTVTSTHPLSQERFDNFVRANAELAASMGFTVK